MKLIYHHRTQADDGQAVHIRSLIQAFESEGHEVREVSLVRHTAPGRKAPASTPGPTPGPARGAGRGWGWMTRVPRFVRELAEYAYSPVGRGRILKAAVDFEPDLIYERYAFANLAGIQAARRLGVPLVLEVNSPMVLELSRTRGLSFPRLARKTEEHVFRTADRVCTVTRVLLEMLVDLGVERERLFVTPNGVHPELYAAGDSEHVLAARRRARADLGLGSQDWVLGFVGYYRDWHRLDRAIDALSLPAFAGARLCLIGEGPAHAALQEHAASRGVTERVVFAGPRQHAEIPGLLTAFDAALVPAINPYASPLKLHEYMAAGLAVVAPDQPNLREVLRDGENGLLFDPGSDDAFLEACTRLRTDTELCRRLGAAARETIGSADLTWRGNVRRVLAAIEGVRA